MKIIIEDKTETNKTKKGPTVEYKILDAQTIYRCLSYGAAREHSGWIGNIGDQKANKSEKPVFYNHVLLICRLDKLDNHYQ